MAASSASETEIPSQIRIFRYSSTVISRRVWKADAYPRRPKRLRSKDNYPICHLWQRWLWFKSCEPQAAFIRLILRRETAEWKVVRFRVMALPLCSLQKRFVAPAIVQKSKGFHSKRTIRHRHNRHNIAGQYWGYSMSWAHLNHWKKVARILENQAPDCFQTLDIGRKYRRQMRYN